MVASPLESTDPKPKEKTSAPEGFFVNRKGFIEMDGEVVELLPAASFRIKLSNDHEILAHLSGKMRKFRIKVLIGDKVKIEVNSYDETKGRIVQRI